MGEWSIDVKRLGNSAVETPVQTIIACKRVNVCDRNSLYKSSHFYVVYLCCSIACLAKQDEDVWWSFRKDIGYKRRTTLFFKWAKT